MGKLIYWATSETLKSAVDQIPHVPSRSTIGSLAKSLVAQTNHWEFVSGWWYPRACTLSKYPSRGCTEPSLARVVELNRFVTNAVSTRSGEYKALQSSVVSPELFFQRYLRISETGSAKQKLKQAIVNAIRLRADQVFHDGNHRTALLLLYEVLAEHKLLVQAKPMTLYILLSNRSDYSEHGKREWNEVEKLMYQHCRSRLKFLMEVPSAEERIVLYANAVKTLEIANSLFNQLAELWFATEAKHLAQKRRGISRQFKNLNRGLYEQFYRLCVLGSWEGPPLRSGNEDNLCGDE